MSEQDERVGALRAALERGAAAASEAALSLWVLAAATVFLGTRVGARARDVGEAKGRGETVVLQTGGLVLVAEVVAALALLAALVLLVRWVRAAASVLPLVGEDAPARGPHALTTLWRAGGEAARPKVIDLFAVLLPTSALAVVALLLVPRTYGNAQALDLTTLGACVLGLVASLLGIGVLRRISDRHVARAAYVSRR